jgi:hypothetical protein
MTGCEVLEVDPSTLGRPFVWVEAGGDWVLSSIVLVVVDTAVSSNRTELELKKLFSPIRKSLLNDKQQP